jgi:hypothetical protein
MFLFAVAHDLGVLKLLSCNFVPKSLLELLKSMHQVKQTMVEYWYLHPPCI